MMMIAAPAPTANITKLESMSVGGAVGVVDTEPVVVSVVSVVVVLSVVVVVVSVVVVVVAEGSETVIDSDN